MGLINAIFGFNRPNTQELIKNGAAIIDVRTPGEFASGHVNGSVNIPLDTIKNNVERIKKMKKPIILCCASGMRSGQATSFLKRAGLDEVYNGGSWASLM